LGSTEGFHVGWPVARDLLPLRQVGRVWFRIRGSLFKKVIIMVAPAQLGDLPKFMSTWSIKTEQLDTSHSNAFIVGPRIKCINFT
jgi:hypothetical protein